MRTGPRQENGLVFFFPALVIMLVFYLVIPGVGAFGVRARWRNFRKNCLEASLRPHLSISSRHRQTEGPLEDEIYRFSGTLDAVGNDGMLWLKSPNMTVKVDLSSEDRICFLPDQQNELTERAVEKNRELLSDEVPLIQKYSQVVLLPLGTKIYLAGKIYREKNALVFRSCDSHPLFILVFKGKVSTLLRRAIWCGRQRNEYWNALTPPSIITGTLGMVLLSYFLAVSGMPPRFTVAMVLGALIPILIFLPPGIVFYWLYRKLWGSARSMRAERDLIRLPLRFFSGQNILNGAVVGLPDGQRYAAKSLKPDEIPEAILSGARIRTTVLDRKSVDRSEPFIFGQLDPAGTGKLMRPDDPVIEYIITFGRPGERAMQLQKKAVAKEALSIFFFAAAIAINYVLALLLSFFLI
jgi:hypothetical protein